MKKKNMWYEAFLMRWSNSKVWLRQLNVQIISARVNENNRWKRNAKKTAKQNKIKNMQTNKQKKNTEAECGTEAIVKGWELNDFVVYLSFLELICKARAKWGKQNKNLKLLIRFFVFRLLLFYQTKRLKN